MTISGMTITFAANQTGGSRQPGNHGQPARIDFSQMSNQIKAALDSLVTAGTITQTQEDAVLKTLPTSDRKGGMQAPGKNPMDSLVTAGTITQAEADAIQKALDAGRDSKVTMKVTLDSLVTAGTITQAQEDAVLKALPTPDRKGGPQGQGKNPMDSLVTAGTITQAQADAIQKALEAGRDTKVTMKDTLNSLVTADTITQVQEDTILKSLTPPDRKDGMQAPGKNPMDSLVTAGTITQAQADAIQNALKSVMDSVNKIK